MARKIDSAVEHGIGMFLFDWYWYNSPKMPGVPDLQVYVFVCIWTQGLSWPTRKDIACMLVIVKSVCVCAKTR